jgi:lipopolysaccharide transport system permease protein
VSHSASKSPLSLLNPWLIVANLWRHRDLIWQFTLREIHIRHKGSQLGFVWTLVNPLSMLGLYFFIFGVIYQSKFHVLANETNFDFALALFLGLSLFHVFAETLAVAPSIIAANSNFVKKVIFPLEILPVAKVCDTTFHLAVSLTLVLVGSAFGTAGLSWQILWLPVLLLPLLLLALGLAWSISAIGVFVRDVSQLTPFVATAIMFSSAVFHSPLMFDHAGLAWRILRLNPLLQIINLTREVVLWDQPMEWMKLGYVYGCATCVVLAGHLCFGLLRRSFAEVI